MGGKIPLLHIPMPQPKFRSLRVDAVVLRHSDYGEADRLLTLYTRQRGKMRVIAKGARKIASRKAGHIEPFTHVKLQLAAAREMLRASATARKASMRRRFMLGIAMPLKYMADMPMAVKITGMIHGILFVAFLVLAWETANTLNKKTSWFLKACFASIIPFGTFVLDKELKKTEQSL